ncbi:hypothetical protein FD37_GL001547 [Levilactobacillus spicheri DSM 15429]|uniref:Glycosyl hydrolase family 8 n=2 Tax=Levilactobacillus spicheri TaxID=216463 RepID=A0ABQ0WS66_9LACO|nr:hypothetical protein FD37_GL001547 [Levilactobacillus spicheri DSM 15429]GEO67893.1 hypothetical protein LSP04_23120 [Levilactobacillus spicheri]
MAIERIFAESRWNDVRKRRLGWLLGGLLLLGLAGCQAKSATMTPPTQSPKSFVTTTTNHTARDQQRQRQVATFVQSKLSSQQGIYTNYLDTATRKTGTATGHELLSESAGMWLLYLAQQRRFKAFRTFYQATVTTFGDHGQFSYRYDPRSKKRFAVNATLDDLRIIRALNVYDALSGTHRYRQTAADHFAALKEGVLKKGRVYDYYDPATKTAAKTSSLAYLDFKTLRFYERGTKAGRAAYREQLKVVNGGYLGDVFPLYAASFNWQTLAYATKNLNTSEALETLLHLAEIGQLRAASKGWLRQQVRHHQLYNGYTTAGSASDLGQSAANYALAAMIFATIGDRANYHRAMAWVWQDQVTQASPLKGGLGDAKTRQSYSYTNLTALNAAGY